MTVALTKTPQFIERDGKPEFVVIAYEDYVIHFRADVTIPHEVVKLSVKHGSLIKAWRAHKGLSQKDVAKRMGVSQAAYSQMEKGKKHNAETLAKIAKAFRIDPLQLNLDN